MTGVCLVASVPQPTNQFNLITRTGHANPGHDDIGIAGASQSVVGGVGGPNREPGLAQVVDIRVAVVIVGFDEEDELRSGHGTCLSGTTVKRPSSSRQVR